MTKFEQIGVNYQYDAMTKEQCKKCFNYSCNCCVNRGMHIDCDRCAISTVHNLVMATFDGKED